MSRSRQPPPRHGSSIGRFFRRQAWLIVLTGYAAILFAAFFPVDYRDQSAAHSLAAWLAIVIRSLTFHIGLAVAIVAGLALIGRCLVLAVCSIPLVLFCVGDDLRDLRGKPAQSAAGETISIMTFSLGTSADKTAVLAEIAEASPEVLLLQEFTNDWQTALHETLTQTYRYFREIPRGDPFGTAIYSRRTFDEAEERRSGKFVSLADNRIHQARAVIRVDNRPMAIYNLYLVPPLRSDGAAICRTQFADLLDQLKRETLPTVVAGDFNFTRRTPQGQELKGLDYADAHQLIGKGRGGTWPVNPRASWFPLLQLDHVYVSPQLVATECRTGQAAGSDHLPVIARVGFGAPDNPAIEGPGPTKSAVGAAQAPKTDLDFSSAVTTSSSASSPSIPAKPLFPPAKLLPPSAGERPPRRAPVGPAGPADGSLPPRRAPWSPGDEPPDRAPDAPSPRAPAASP